MTTDVAIVARSWWKWWPCFGAGFCGPFLGLFLARWLPFHFAMGISFFVLWFFVGLMFARRSTPTSGLPGWLAAVLVGAAAGVTGFVLSFFFSWQ